ncbi:hypothetical protein GCM10009000_112800 [Halobacterium noricense]
MAVRRAGSVEWRSIGVDEQVIAPSVVTVFFLKECQPVFGNVEAPVRAANDCTDCEVRD